MVVTRDRALRPHWTGGLSPPNTGLLGPGRYRQLEVLIKLILWRDLITVISAN